ncbi:MAG: hypothetical protein QOF76_2441, partial [Solirubrobacteraceae bacterium]|nr:hypothetical protein [Solirubrobacteraceae bacterium]
NLQAPGSRFELLPDAAHFPHLEDAAGLSDALERFIAQTQPADLSRADWARLVQLPQTGQGAAPRAA